MTRAPAKPKAKTGAPKGSGSKYTQALADDICERLSSGEPLRSICRDPKIPHWNSVYRWMEEDATFSVRIAHARDIGHDAIAEEALQIANTPIVGVTKTYKADGTVEAKEEDMLGHRKLQIETRLKLLAKWNPKRYGDKIELRGDPSAPLQLVLNGSDVNG